MTAMLFLARWLRPACTALAILFRLRCLGARLHQIRFFTVQVSGTRPIKSAAPCVTIERGETYPYNSVGYI